MRNTFDLTYSQARYPTCPHCGAEVERTANNSWIDVAHVTNLAEAGFLTDELNGLGIDAQIYQLEEFSALTDRWSTVYLIRVPSHKAHQAAAQIRQHLADEVAETESGAMGFRFSADVATMDPLFWRPWRWWSWQASPAFCSVSGFPISMSIAGHNAERFPRHLVRSAGPWPPNQSPVSRVTGYR